jgi:hypothetical protein
MATYYEIPGGLAWVKQNLQTIIGNEPLEEIMKFGDQWRSRGHTPLVHVVSPSMDDGKMWDNHKDPSGLLDNVPSHIDLFIVDFNNRYEPELPKMWWTNKWLLWEYKGGYVKFNGDYNQFVRTFGVDPEDDSTQPPSGGTGDTGGGSTGGGSFPDVNIHMTCPHCGKQIF